MERKVNVLVADDHKLLCQALQQLLITMPFINHVYIAYDGRQALDQVQTNHIDLALLDVRMPVMDGLQAAEYILKNYTKTKVIAMTFHAADATIVEILRIGVHGILLKQTCDFSSLEMAISQVMSGLNYFCASTEKVLSQNLKQLQEPLRTRFTPRQLDVLRLTCDGKTAKEIAMSLNITKGSTENYRKELLHKTKTSNVAELVSFAIRNGIV